MAQLKQQLELQTTELVRHAADRIQATEEAAAKQVLEAQQLLQCARGHFRSGRNGGWAATFTVAQSIEVDREFARRFAGRAAPATRSLSVAR